MSKRMDGSGRGWRSTSASAPGWSRSIGLLITLDARRRASPGSSSPRARTPTSTRPTRSTRTTSSYQKLFGGEAMLTVITMDKGHTVDELLNDTNRRQARRPSARSSRRTRRTSSASSRRSTRSSSRTTSWRARPAIRRRASPARRSSRRRPGAGRGPGEAPRRRRHHARSASAKVPCADQTIANPDWVKFLLVDNQGQIRKALLPFFPDQRHALIITRLQGNASIEQEGRGADFTTATMKSLELPARDDRHRRRRGAAERHQQVPQGRDAARSARSPIAIMIVILLVLFDVRWRLLPLGIVLIGVIWAFGLAGYLGIPLTLVTISGLPVMLGIGIDYAIQMHARVEEEVVIDHSEHPIQEIGAQPRSRAARRHVRRDLRLRGAALLEGADDPQLRSAARGRRRRDLLRARSWARSRRSASASTGRRRRRATTARARSDASSSGSAACRGRSRRRSSIAALVVFVGGVLVEDKLEIQTDPIEWVNPDSTAVQNIHKIERQAGISSELGMYVVSGDAFSDKTVKFVDEFTTEQLCRYGDAERLPEDCPADAKAVPGEQAGARERVEHREHRQLPHRGARARSRSSPTGDEVQAGVRRRAGRHPEVDGEQGRQGDAT